MESVWTRMIYRKSSLYWNYKKSVKQTRPTGTPAGRFLHINIQKIVSQEVTSILVVPADPVLKLVDGIAESTAVISINGDGVFVYLQNFGGGFPVAVLPCSVPEVAIDAGASPAFSVSVNNQPGYPISDAVCIHLDDTFQACHRLFLLFCIVRGWFLFSLLLQGLYTNFKHPFNEGQGIAVHLHLFLPCSDLIRLQLPGGEVRQSAPWVAGPDSVFPAKEPFRLVAGGGPNIELCSARTFYEIESFFLFHHNLLQKTVDNLQFIR